MLRDTSAASTSSRSVVCAPTPPAKASRAARKTAAVTADRIGNPRRQRARIGPPAAPWKGVAGSAPQPHISLSEITDDAYRPDPPVDRHRAARDQGNHRRGRAMDRAPAHLGRPVDRLYPAHLGLAAD